MEVDMTKRPIAAREFKVALLLPLSGPHAEIGESMRQAAEMSLFDTSDSSLQLLPFDTKGTPAGAKEAGRVALNKNVDLILGPVFAPEARTLKTILGSSPLPVISYSTDLSLAEPGFFVFGFDVVEQIRAIMKYATSKDIQSVVALLPNNEYGQVVEKELNSLHSLHQIRIEKILKYDDSERNFSTLAQQIKTINPQALFIPEGGVQLTTILSSLQYHDLDISQYQLLGTGQWDHPQVLYHKAAEGGWFASPSVEDRVAFEKRFKETYGSEPHRLASLAYDSISMTEMLIRTNPENPFRIVSMTQSQGYSGADGLFRLLSNGDTERSLAIFEVKEWAIELLQSAARTF